MKKEQKKTSNTPDMKEKKYWSSLDEYNNVPDPDSEKEEKEQKNQILSLFEDKTANSRSNRRDFLKLFGFSITSAVIASSCEKPIQKAIPYVIRPEEITPGQSLHYASTFFDGKDYCSVVVKTRDGRPIKIEGNRLSDFNGGGTTARVQASVLSLYDDARYKEPMKAAVQTDWEEIDSEIRKKLSEVSSSGKEIVFLSSSVISPSTRVLINSFGQKYTDFKWVQYDPVSHYGIRKAHEMLYGSPVIPDLRFDKADVVVGFQADFLGSWLAPAHFIPLYASRKKLSMENKDMLRHYQFEPGMTVTGSNADHRFPIKPAEEKKTLIALYNQLAGNMGVRPLESVEIDTDISIVVEDMLKAGERSLVVSGSNDVECQMLAAAINRLMGSVGTTVDMNNVLSLAGGNDEKMSDLVEEIKRGQTGALIIHGVNPVYDYPEGKALGDAIRKLDLAVSISWIKNETSESCTYLCPEHHYLESWGDAEIMPGKLSLSQPALRPVFNTRSVQDCLLKWSGEQGDYQEYLQEFWKERYWEEGENFQDFWNKTLQEGVHNYDISGEWSPSYNSAALDGIRSEDPVSGFTIVLNESVQMGDGKYANNPWLQELPDPIAKVCWDNFIALAPADAKKMGVGNGDLVSVNNIFEIPVLIQPGQAESTGSISLGYGREAAGKVGEGIGANAFQLVRIENGYRKYYIEGASIEPTGENIILALTQTHNSMEGRPIVREATLDEYLESADAGNELHEEYESHHKTLYPDLEFDGFHWGLAIDLNACVGCNTCVISCQAENNIPVVGKSEVYRRRIMHWIKIDRYYSDNPKNPKVSYQPNLCQHCDNAPCENVCPVSATNHSSEGINQMSYNRCVGTKYCINNCPYRARRFNWYKYVNNEEFDYNANSDLGKMVLNPDVTVRSRGVVEKCSFCVQRIQEKKMEAKLENRQLKDGEVQPACVQACPAGALVFGNLKDKNSKVSRMFENPRNYHLLEQLHTLPSVGYLTKIRNEKKT
jgi:molybdopterin-containing oxidoreductase family iron-sulfur binding subunit